MRIPISREISIEPMRPPARAASVGVRFDVNSSSMWIPFFMLKLIIAGLGLKSRLGFAGLGFTTVVVVRVGFERMMVMAGNVRENEFEADFDNDKSNKNANVSRNVNLPDCVDDSG